MIDASDRTLLWGGARIYEVWNKRLQVTVTYAVMLAVLGVVVWIPISFILDALAYRSFFVKAVPMALAVALVLTFIAFLLARPLSSWGIHGSDEQTRELARAVVLAESLCSQVGLEVPEILVAPSDAINATSYVKARHRSTMVLTRGALGTLSHIQLEAVLAREVARIRSGLGTYDAFLVFPRRLFAVVSFGWYPRKMNPAFRFELDLVDLAALTVMRFPPALAAALDEVLKEGSEHPELHSVAARAGGWLWLNPASYRDAVDLLQLRRDELREW